VSRSSIRLIAAFFITLAWATSAAAQDEDDSVLRLAEPDFSLISLPTTLRVPTFKSAFRVTHRFQRPLGAGDFGDLAGDLFGLDAGAQIGLEYRFGIIPNGQIGIHRTSSKTIQFFGQYGVARQGARMPVEIAAQVSVEGTNNFKDSYTPVIGAVVSRRFGDAAAIYVEPLWANNTNELPSEVVDDNSTFVLGLGARFRIRPTVYVTGEFVPRVAGYDPGKSHTSFAIEKRAGGHTFQLNFSNSFGTTMGQVARGAANNDDWYMGFNISRKFF
jgi:hypothetical protein